MNGKEMVKRIIKTAGFEVIKAQRKVLPQRMLPVTPEQFFDLYFSMVDKEKFFLVQIGANDGKSRDRMHDYVTRLDLSGILVEPQKQVFEKLKQSYAGRDKISFANVAIGNKEGELTFYTVKDSLINEENYFETTAIASLDKSTIENNIKKRIPKIIERISDDINDYISESKVACLTFDSFVKKFNVPVFDFLFLDCEGYDYEILKTIDFSKHTPKMINFESKFLSDVEREECEKMLSKNGYQYFRHGNDTCAFRIL
jgi:FkbM family methyltransferase